MASHLRQVFHRIVDIMEGEFVPFINRSDFKIDVSNCDLRQRMDNIFNNESRRRSSFKTDIISAFVKLSDGDIIAIKLASLVSYSFKSTRPPSSYMYNCIIESIKYPIVNADMISVDSVNPLSDSKSIRSVLQYKRLFDDRHKEEKLKSESEFNNLTELLNPLIVNDPNVIIGNSGDDHLVLRLSLSKTDKSSVIKLRQIISAMTEIKEEDLDSYALIEKV